MPWEKSFDEELALNKAMQVFWKKGFKSTSIADLIKGTGVNRGSLYNAFGGKQALFETVLVKYDRDRRRARLAELEAKNNPKQAIFDFFDTLVADTLADKEKKGCFLINSASEINSHDDHVAGIIRNGICEIEAFFQRCIEVGQVRGMIRTELNAEVTANALLANLVAIRVLGRGALNEDALRSIANTAKQSIA